MRVTRRQGILSVIEQLIAGFHSLSVIQGPIAAEYETICLGRAAEQAARLAEQARAVGDTNVSFGLFSACKASA